jgi:hypothetical protein
MQAAFFLILAKYTGQKKRSSAERFDRVWCGRSAGAALSIGAITQL